MEFRYLVSFLAIAEKLHFGRAAAMLHISQPSLTQHLQRLERAIGVDLVHRSSHRVELTEAGAVFQREARRVLRQLDEAVETTRAAGSGYRGTVRIGFNYPAGRRVLPPTLNRLARDRPLLRTVLVEKRSGPQLAGLSARELDVAFVFGPPTDPQYAYRVVFSTPLMAAVGLAHPLAGRRSVTFAELSEHDCILFDREQSPASYDALMRAAELSGHPLRVADHVDDPIGTGVMVSTGSVVGFLSATRAAALDPTEMTALALTDPEPVLDVCAVWRADDASPRTSAFLQCLAAVGPFAADEQDPARNVAVG